MERTLKYVIVAVYNAGTYHNFAAIYGQS